MHVYSFMPVIHSLQRNFGVSVSMLTCNGMIMYNSFAPTGNPAKLATAYVMCLFAA